MPLKMELARTLGWRRNGGSASVRHTWTLCIKQQQPYTMSFLLGEIVSFVFVFCWVFFFWFVFSCFLSFLKDRKELIRRKRNGREGAAQRRLLVYEVVIIHSELSFPNDSSNKQILSMWRMVSSGRIKKSGFGLTFFFSFFFSHHFEDYLLACRNWMY